MPPLIQIFIPTYNRPTLVLNAINSALNQTFSSFELIVSDNSTSDETENILKDIFDNRLIYKRRKPSLEAIDHFNTILKEVTSKYFMIFHDDDTMIKNSLSVLYNKIMINSKYGVIAVGSNANCIKNGKSFLYNASLKSDVLIDNKNELIRRYLLYDIVPFSSYLYRSDVAKKLKLEFDKGGKYCDASFIVSLLNLGSILHISIPLMNYYLHSGQDSCINDFIQKLQLIKFYTNNSSFSSNHPLIVRFRLQNIFVEFVKNFKKDNFKLFTRHNKKIAFLLFKYSKFEYFPRFIYAIGNKYFKKLFT